MNLRTILYAGLMAASVGCVDKKVEDEQQRLLDEGRQLLLEERQKEQQRILEERQNKLGELCEATYNTAMTVATLTSSEHMWKILHSHEWCDVLEQYERDQRELTIIAEGGARVYCRTRRSEAERVLAKRVFITANEKSLDDTHFQHRFSCEGNYEEVIHQVFDLQHIFNSYQK